MNLENLENFQNPENPEWMRNYENLRKYIEEKGDLPRFTDLEIWISKQKLRFRRGELPYQQIELLNNLEHWTWSIEKIDWNTEYVLLHNFILRNNRLPMFSEGKTGRWAVVQRHKYRNGKLNLEQITLLEKLSLWDWNPPTSVKKSWYQAYNLVSDFIEKNRRIPMCKEVMGRWAVNQRYKYRNGKLSIAQIELLESLDFWDWNPTLKFPEDTGNPHKKRDRTEEDQEWNPHKKTKLIL